jgi:hypothetical protein
MNIYLGLSGHELLVISSLGVVFRLVTGLLLLKLSRHYLFILQQTKRSITVELVSL